MRQIISGSRAGFSMLEVILSLIILGILALMGTMGFLDIIKGYQVTQNNMQSVVDTDIFKGIQIQLSHIYKIKKVAFMEGTGNKYGKSITYTALKATKDTDGKIKVKESSQKTFTLPTMPSGTALRMRFLNKDSESTTSTGQIYFIELSRETTVGEKTKRSHVLLIAPYHLQYRNQ